MSVYLDITDFNPQRAAKEREEYLKAFDEQNLEVNFKSFCSVYATRISFISALLGTTAFFMMDIVGKTTSTGIFSSITLF